MLPRDLFDNMARLLTSGDSALHAPIIFGLAKWLRPDSCVEVGTDAGGMAIHIARALQELYAEGWVAKPGHLTCIDDFSLRGEQGHARFWHTIGYAQVGDVVTLSRAKSTDPAAWPERVDFAFIDGDHSLDGCADDVQQAYQRGAKCIVVHDVQNWWGPREWLRLKDAHSTAPDDILRVPFCGGLAILLRREEMPPPQFTQGAYPEGHI